MRRMLAIALLLTLILALAGCDDDFFDSDGGDGRGGADTGGDYDAYWNTIETISVEGYIPEMTQKQEPPAPQGDQEDCPTVMVLLMLLGGLWGWQGNRKAPRLQTHKATLGIR